jgi:hypothetical protein
MAVIIIMVAMRTPATLSTQDRGTIRFVIATPFAVHIVAGSGKVDTYV